MTQGFFYFLKDEYYDSFQHCGLMTNKGIDHGRPCYFSIEYNGLAWMIPISSKVDKYQRIYDKQSAKYKNYYGIRFGYVLGNKRAFLLQNICPVTDVYIDNLYINKSTRKPVTIDHALTEEIEKCAIQIIKLHEKHIKVTMTDIDTIMTGLF